MTKSRVKAYTDDLKLPIEKVMKELGWKVKVKSNADE
jgi:hypothetical protein